MNGIIIKCEHCNKPISLNMAKASMNRFRKQLCFDGQEEEIKKTYPPKLAAFSLDNLRKIRARYGM